MLIHVLLNYQKDLKQEYIYPPYIKILGFNNRGQVYLNKIKKKISIPLSTKIVANNINSLEIKCATIYQMISNEDVLTFELANKPIKKP